MKIAKIAVSSALLAVASMASADTYTFIGPGNMGNAASWSNTVTMTTGALPGAGDVGYVAIDAAFPTTAAAANLAIAGDLVIGGGASQITVTAATDFVAKTPSSITINNAIINAGDDIYTGGATGNYIFNAGSEGNAIDDFQANGGGTITINGGTHSAAKFGAQNSSTMSFLGGTAEVGSLGLGSESLFTIGGDATLTTGVGTEFTAFDEIQAFTSGTRDILADWTGSWTAEGVDAAAWETQIVDGGWTFGGTDIDATVFAENFEVSTDGLTLTAIPEPATLGLVAAFGGAVLFIRRRFMI
jgi:hypothetical protein